MAEKIKVMVVDDSQEARESIKKILSLEEDIEITGEAEDGKNAIELAKKLSPDIILMDINMPVLDGISACEIISQEMPHTGVIILSIQGEQEYFRRAMISGAKDYLVKPFSPDELINSIRKTKKTLAKKIIQKEEKEKHIGKIITIIGTKGGVGKSLIAVNLAISIYQITKEKTVIVDLNLQFGDIAIMLNIKPNLTISDLSQKKQALDMEIIDKFLFSHSSGIKILPAPYFPASAEYVTSDIVKNVLSVLKENGYNVIVDTAGYFTDCSLTALDLSDIVLLITTLDLPTIKNSKIAIDTIKSLNYPQDKIKVVLNRSDSKTGLTPQHIENVLGLKISASIPSDGKLVIPSVNSGIPFVIESPNAEISKMVNNLAYQLLDIVPPQKETPKLSTILKKFSKK